MLCTTIHDACTNEGNLRVSCVRFTASLVYDCARLNNGDGKRVHRDSRGIMYILPRKSRCINAQQLLLRERRDLLP